MILLKRVYLGYKAHKGYNSLISYPGNLLTNVNVSKDGQFYSDNASMESEQTVKGAADSWLVRSSPE